MEGANSHTAERVGGLRKWVLLAHPWSFPASVSPAVVAGSYAYCLYRTGGVDTLDWVHGILAVIGVVFFHAAGNILGDYHDFLNGVDLKEKSDRIRPIAKGYFTPKSALLYGCSMLLIGILLGLYLMMRTGLPLLFIGLVGVLSATLYYKFKYVALGDLMIFICYGLAIALGMVYVMTGQLVWAVLPVSAPLGLLIVAILHANNTRDIEQDRSAGIRTLAMNQGLEGAQVTYQAFLLTAYLLVALLVMLKLMSPYTFLVLLSFPLAMKNIRQMNRATMDYPGAIQTLDARTSLLVMLFGLLQVTGNVIAALI